MGNNTSDQIVIVVFHGSGGGNGNGSGGPHRSHRGGSGSNLDSFNRSGTDFDESILNVAFFGVPFGSSLVGHSDQSTVGIDVRVLASHLVTVTVFVVCKVGLFVIIGNLVRVSVLRIGLQRNQFLVLTTLRYSKLKLQFPRICKDFQGSQRISKD